MKYDAVVHASQSIPWHLTYADHFVAGLREYGLSAMVTTVNTRLPDQGFPILLGTTLWRNLEEDGGPFLLVDRCSFGDKDKWVQLVWGGRGRRGDHKVPENADGSRWAKYGVPFKPWRRSGKRIVLCGQMDTNRSPEWPNVEVFYNKARAACTHFRSHPAGYNPTSLPTVNDWRDVKLAVTLNSSVGVQAVLDGIPAVTFDSGSMAFDVTTHDLEAAPVTPERMEWCRWLAWTQWSDQEIREGVPWDYHL